MKHLMRAGPMILIVLLLSTTSTQAASIGEIEPTKSVVVDIDFTNIAVTSQFNTDIDREVNLTMTVGQSGTIGSAGGIPLITSSSNYFLEKVHTTGRVDINNLTFGLGSSGGLIRQPHVMVNMLTTFDLASISASAGIKKDSEVRKRLTRILRIQSGQRPSYVT